MVAADQHAAIRRKRKTCPRAAHTYLAKFVLREHLALTTLPLCNGLAGQSLATRHSLLLSHAA